MVPRAETRHGIEIRHPRYPVIPKVGANLAPHLMHRAVLQAVRRTISLGYDFDLIDAHYFYPDGVAAALIGRSLGKPVVITARGSDINTLARFRIPRRMIVWAAEQAGALISVSQALKNAMIELGIPEQKITVLRNGVDLETFAPQDRQAIRSQLGLEGPIILSAGNLVPLKGHDLVIQALRDLPTVTLLIAGGGPDDTALRSLARALGVAGRVRFLGTVPHGEMPALYSAADALLLASEREGWPNVLLESMACGTPVISTAVGGAPEVVRTPESGVLVFERTAAALMAATRDLLARPPSREAPRAYAEEFAWQPTTDGQCDIFESVCRSSTDRQRYRTTAPV
jgi:glycosyltransferase involved in cell wall biosynthesis